MGCFMIVFTLLQKVFLVLEMCRGGELSDLLKEKNRFKEDVSLNL